MVFSSNFFIFLFLPLFLLVYYAIPARWRSVYILLGSWSFYAWWRLDFLAVLMAITLWNYCIGQQLHRAQKAQDAFLLPEFITAKSWLILGVVGNIATLGYYKYFNFGVDSWNGLMISFGGSEWVGWSVILPIGISFFIFQSVSYLIDVYRNDAPPADNLINFAAFIALFPQLIAGPVLRYKDLAHQFESRSHTGAKLREGAERFVVGLAKKVLIADTVATIADPIFSLQEPSFFEAWLGIIAYTVQLYFDFSGYSCMAIGLGLMMGFRFVENFDAPYRSGSITEFWQRWHISLSTWLRDYLYIPLGGNRGSVVKTYRNLGLTMLLGGVWHGAGWTFVIWGAWHGALLSLERFLKNAQLPWRATGILGVALTMFLVMIGWVFFRAADVNAALTMLSGMFGLQGWSIQSATWWQLPSSGFWVLGIAILLIYLQPFKWPLLSRLWQQLGWWLRAPLCACGLLLSSAKLGADAYSPFLYFQF